MPSWRMTIAATAGPAALTDILDWLDRHMDKENVTEGEPSRDSPRERHQIGKSYQFGDILRERARKVDSVGHVRYDGNVRCSRQRVPHRMCNAVR